MALPSAAIFAAIKDCSVCLFFLMFIYVQPCLVFIAVSPFLWLWRAGAALQSRVEGSLLPWLLPLQGTTLLWHQQWPHAGSAVAVPGLQSTGSVVAAQHVGSYWVRSQTRVSCIGRGILYHRATREALFFVFVFLNHNFQFVLYSFSENVKIIHYLLIPQSECKGFSFVSRLGSDVDLV